MDLREYSKFANSTFRYCPPKCFELSGKSFELQMDDGYDMVISFAMASLPRTMGSSTKMLEIW